MILTLDKYGTTEFLTDPEVIEGKGKWVDITPVSIDLTCTTPTGVIDYTNMQDNHRSRLIIDKTSDEKIYNNLRQLIISAEISQRTSIAQIYQKNKYHTFKVKGTNLGIYISGGGYKRIGYQLDFYCTGSEYPKLRWASGNASKAEDTSQDSYSAIDIRRDFCVTAEVYNNQKVDIKTFGYSYDFKDQKEYNKFLNYLWLGTFDDAGTGDNTEPSGGKGDYDQTSDAVGLPPMPPVDAVSSKMLKVYNPSAGQLAAFSNWLWSSDIFTNLKKMFQDPMQAILGLNIMPIELPYITPQNIFLGNLDSGVTAFSVDSQFYEIDFGTLKIPEKWGTFLDYAPYTSLDIYLPFIGSKKLDTNLCINADLHLTYRIDVVSGACVAFINVSKKGFNSTVYSFTGNCGYQIPLSANNLQAQTQAIAGLAVSGVVAAATQNPIAMGGAALAAANAAINYHDEIERTTGGGLNTGYFGVWYPYITVTRPVQSLPKNYAKFNGKPSNIYGILGDFEGYLEVDQVRAGAIQNANAEEKAEIEKLLKGGIIV